MAALPADGDCEPTWLPDPDLSGSPNATLLTTSSSLNCCIHSSSIAHYIIIVALLLLNMVVPLPHRPPPSYDDIQLSLLPSRPTSSSSLFVTSDVFFSPLTVDLFSSFSTTRCHIVDLDSYSSFSFSQMTSSFSFLSATPSSPGHLYNISPLRHIQLHRTPPAHVNSCRLWL